MRVPTRRTTKIPEAQDPLMTRQKFEQLEKKLISLKKQRPSLAAEVSRLAELGDFSENVEYQLAKGKLRQLNSQLLRLDHQLLHAQVIEQKYGGDVIEIGSTVVVEQQRKKNIYQILGSTETNPSRGIVSHTSPIGAALLGKRVGETAIVTSKNGNVVYTIISIQ